MHTSANYPLLHGCWGHSSRSWLQIKTFFFFQETSEKCLLRESRCCISTFCVSQNAPWKQAAWFYFGNWCCWVRTIGSKEGKAQLGRSRCEHAMGIQEAVRARLRTISDPQVYFTLRLRGVLGSRQNGEQFLKIIPYTPWKSVTKQ